MNPDLELAVRVVSEVFELPAGQLTRPGRHAEIVRARWVVMRILYGEVGYGWSDIARMLGMDHGTVSYGFEACMELQGQDRLYFERCGEATQKFRVGRREAGRPVALAEPEKRLCPLCGQERAG